jgi:hypothetical protein
LIDYNLITTWFKNNLWKNVEYSSICDKNSNRFFF